MGEAVKTLILLRHGKAKHPAGIADIDRPLTDSAPAAVERTVWAMLAKGHRPDLVIASAARRTRETAAVACASMDPEPHLIFTPQLYLATAAMVLATVAALPGLFGQVMVVGHNPGLEDLLQVAAGQRLAIDTMPTAGLAVCRVHCPSWEALSLDDLELLERFRP